jgi:hypothetical protein
MPFLKATRFDATGHVNAGLNGLLIRRPRKPLQGRRLTCIYLFAGSRARGGLQAAAWPILSGGRFRTASEVKRSGEFPRGDVLAPGPSVMAAATAGHHAPAHHGPQTRSAVVRGGGAIQREPARRVGLRRPRLAQAGIPTRARLTIQLAIEHGWSVGPSSDSARSSLPSMVGSQSAPRSTSGIHAKSSRRRTPLLAA